MYTAYWGLSRQPFDNGDQPEFFHRGEPHQAALLKLRYVLESGLGTGLLVGGTGSGKSFLVGQLAHEMPERFAPFVRVVYPHFTAAEFLCYVAAALGRGNAEENPAALEERTLDRTVRRIEDRLAVHARNGRHPVIVIDEAHQIDDPRVLQAVLSLLNLQPRNDIDFSLLLVGERSLVPRLRRFAQLDERIGVRGLLRALNRAETEDYVAHRLRAAGRATPIFRHEAFDALHDLSGGVPRRINRLCDFALLVGYADGLREITPDEFAAVAEELVGALPD
ncbi:MAG: AAA family ATPase [Planctomycetaceae bacterium]